MNKELSAFNFITLVQYSGSNSGIVGNGELNAFATFKQITNAGYKVNKGAKGISIFCGYREKVDKKTGERVTVPTYGYVFDIIDTNAIDDKDFYNWLVNEATIVKSEVETNQALAGAMLSAI